MLDRLIAVFLSVPAPLVVAAVFLVPAAETAILLGFLLPGELAVILGGVLASRGRVPLSAVLVASVAGPIIGDSIGYYVGRRYGENRPHKRRRRHWAKARSWVRTKGAPAVFLGRFVAFGRTLVPAAAGVAKMPYRKFLAWNAAAGVLWGTGSTLLGYFASKNFERVTRWTGRIGLVLLVAIAVVISGVFLWRKLARPRRRRS